MKKKLYLLSTILVSILFFACSNKDVEAPTSPPIVNKVIDPTGLVQEIKIDNFKNEVLDNSFTMMFSYDEDNRLSKVTNFHGKTLLYQYSDDKISIKEKDDDTEEYYLFYECPIHKGLIEEVNYNSIGYSPEILGKYVLNYDSNQRLLSDLWANTNEGVINYIWNEKGDAITAKRQGVSDQNFKSLEVLNVANIDFSGIIGAYPNSIPLQMLGLIKQLGKPNKYIMVDADFRKYTTKTDEQNRLIEATKTYRDKTQKYTISYYK